MYEWLHIFNQFLCFDGPLFRLRSLTYCLSPVRATRGRRMWCIVRIVLVEAVRTLTTL